MERVTLVHVTPTELRVIRSGDLVLRLARLDRMAYVLVETPAAGSAGTSLEEPCVESHWGVVLRGGLRLERDAHSEELPAGTAFHVPAGPPSHRFVAANRTVLAGFVPIEAGTAFGAPLTGAPAADGSPSSHGQPSHEPVIVRLMRGADPVPIRTGGVTAEAAVMGDWVVSRATLGATSGFGTTWCDLPHWGIVITGGVVIEWEHDVEILGAGDVYYCPAGPPGHRIEAADGASIVDFTPREQLRSTRRIAEWRPRVDVFETTHTS